MRFDAISIFPTYFEPLKLSLIGKAEAKNLISFTVHDLRDFTDDPHRSVDDTPCGGGAGMVMRPDVWGRALDTVLSDSTTKSGGQARQILAIPTPSGIPLTQNIVQDLAGADQIILACGRYEGIDERVSQYYREQSGAVGKFAGLEVLEFSLGDYVLNGGEVAALALIEAVSRLAPKVIGNPLSLVEESHSSDGLLEYPAYTKPTIWRELKVPEVLLGGNHAHISQWRRQQSLMRTAERRKDLLPKLSPQNLSAFDKEVLAQLGTVYFPEAQNLTFRLAREDEDLALAVLGARTFPSACPKWMTQEAITDFIAVEFNPEAVKKRLQAPDKYQYVVAEIAGELVGYTLAMASVDDHAGFEVAINENGSYLSKCYVDEHYHGCGIAGALLRYTLDNISKIWPQCPILYLGTSTENKRAIKFYKKHGFKKIGSRKFNVGGIINNDIVMAKDLN